MTRKIDTLRSLIQFESVSADPNRKSNCIDCATFLASHFLELGFSESQVVKTKGHPAVIARHIIDDAKPTVLIYGHYDVQPEDPINEWTSPPFELTEKNGQWVARGISDNKGQFYAHICAIAELIQTQSLNVNITFLIEGEEEIGSPNLPELLKSEKERLKADFAVISDMPMFAKGRPSLCISLRGLCYLEVHIKTADSDLHSGQHGGLAPNAIHELVKLLATLTDKDGNILVDGLYEQVYPTDDTRQKQMDMLEFDESSYATSIGSHYLPKRQKGALNRLWTEPSLDINGIWGGYTGEGAKTVIPCEAHAKLSLRLVPNQDDTDVANLLETHLRTHCPDGVELRVEPHHGCAPAYSDPTLPEAELAIQAIQKVWGVNPILQGEGGSIPVVADLDRYLGLNTLMIGLNLPEDRIHAPNEQLSIENFEKGVEVSKTFFMSCEKLEKPQ